jgi:hypothetical protein
MNKPPRVLVFGNAGRPAGELYERLRARGLEPTAVEPGDVLRPDVAPQGCDVAVVFADHDHSPAAEPVELVVRQLVQERVARAPRCGAKAGRWSSGWRATSSWMSWSARSAR